MISLRHVTKEFKLDERTSISPVQDISLDIARGEMIIITGRSGCGKTTLLNLAAGLVKPTAGQVVIDNDDLGGMNEKQLSALRSQKIGFMFQFPSLLPALSLIENVTLPAAFVRRDGENTGERAASLLDAMGLRDKSRAFPKQLSAGEQKRAIIARALINRPQIVLADEPTSDLDMKTELDIMAVLQNINAGGVTFIIVTHNMQLLPYANRAFRMDEGKLEYMPVDKDAPRPTAA